MATVEKLMTAEEFERLPAPIGGGKMELVDGKAVTMAPVGGEHSIIATRLVRALGRFLEEQMLGEIMVEAGFLLRIGPDLVRAPDVAYLAPERMPAGGIPKGYIPAPPTLAIEVVSPEDRDAEVQAKVLEYLEAGTDRVWVVRPSTKTVTVHRPDGTARTLGIDAALTSDDAALGVEGFALPIGELFRG